MIFVISMEIELNMDASFEISDQESLGNIRVVEVNGEPFLCLTNMNLEGLKSNNHVLYRKTGRKRIFLILN